MKTLRLLYLFSISAAACMAQPNILAVQNNYSYIRPGLPNYGIAQGSIFVVFGSNLSNTSTGLQNVPLGTTLEGVSAAVTVNNVTRDVILYYVTPNQIAGILPSNTPVGTGVITVTNNGRTSAPAPIVVVQSAFGILTLDGSGGGAAAVFDAANRFLGPTNATHPGDVIVFYGTGVGPSPGDETMQQNQVNLVSIPIAVEIGGREAEVLYHGRSIFPGLDQINTVVPSGISFGCAVTLTVRSGTYVSNFTTIPVAAGGTTCATDAADPGINITQEEIDRWVAAGRYTSGSFGLTRSTTYSIVDDVMGGPPVTTIIRSDIVGAGFNRIRGNLAGLFNSNFAAPTVGSCIVTTGFTNPFPDLVFTPLDAGTPLRVSGPGGERSVDRSINLGQISYSAEVGPGTPGNYIDPGRYTVTGPGGPDIGAFSTSYDVPPELVWTNRVNLTTIDRSSPVTVRWSGGEPTTLVSIQGQSVITQGVQVTVVLFQCWARNTDGQFTIPPSVLLALPPSPTLNIGPGLNMIQRGSLALATVGRGARIQATGLEYGTVGSQVGVAQSTIWR